MKPKTVYLLFCIAGAVVLYWFFVRWLAENGRNATHFVRQLFANGISTFFALDVLVSALVLLRFVALEGDRLPLKGRWRISLSVVLVGVSLGFRSSSTFANDNCSRRWAHVSQ